jgi:hypothetical protein
LIVALKFQPELTVIYPQIAITAASHRFWCDLRNLLGDHPDIGRVAAIIAEAIEAKAIVQIADKSDVMLESDVRAPAAAATTATTPAATAATAAAPEAAAPAATMGA